MNIQEIDVASIDASDRLRGLNDDYAAAMAASFEAEGQLTPIEVRPADKKGRHALVIGMHRLAAAKLLGWKKITATIFAGTNDEARLREIDENLVRRELSALDRATFLQARAQVWAAMNPELAGNRGAAMARWHAMDTVSFASDAAEKLGTSARTVRRWVALAEALAGLTGEVRARVAVTRLADNPAQLKALAALEDDKQRLAVLNAMLAGGARNVAAAQRVLSGAPEEYVSKSQAEFDAFMGRWSKYNAETRRLVTEFVLRESKSRRTPKA